MNLDVEEHETTELLVGVLRELKDIKEILGRNTKQLFDLQATVDSLTNRYDDTEITFPAKTLEDFEEIEEMMKDNEGREFITMQLKSVLKNNDDMWLLKIIDEDLFEHFAVHRISGKRNILDYSVIKYALNHLNTNKQSISYCMTRVKDRNKKRKSYNSKKSIELPELQTMEAKMEVSRDDDIVEEDVIEDESQIEEEILVQQPSVDDMEDLYEDHTELHFPIKSLRELKVMEKMMTNQTSRQYLAHQLKIIVERNSQSWIADILDEKLLLNFTMNEKEGKSCLLHLKIIDYAINHLKASKRAASYWMRKVKDKLTKRKQQIEPDNSLDYYKTMDDESEIVLEEDIVQQMEEHEEVESTDVKDTQQLVLYIPQSSIAASRKRKKRHFFFPAMTTEDIELMEELMADPMERDDLIFQLEARVDRHDDMWLLKLIDDHLLMDYNTSGKMGKKSIFGLKVICYAVNYLQATKQSVGYAIRKAKDKVYHKRQYRLRQSMKNCTKEEDIDATEDIIEEDDPDDDKSQHYEETLQE